MAYPQMNTNGFLVSPGINNNQDWLSSLRGYGSSYLNPSLTSPDVPSVAPVGPSQMINLANTTGPLGFDPTDKAGLDAVGASIAGQPGLGLMDSLKGWWNNASALNKFDGKGNMTQQGFAMPAIQGLSALMSGFLGMKQYGLAKDQFNFQKDAFATNLAAKKATTNAMLEDRQRARVASNSSAYQSVGDYMNQNGIK